ncbi:hypothetical protein E2O03_000590 [Candidatus Magnetomonas plexicatena]|nr:hypothetical protein E2O03_000590 [Nitrospirales bacterium LBB_01]
MYALLVIFRELTLSGTEDVTASTEDVQSPLQNKKIVLILVILILWAACTGMGGFGYQNGDYHQRNALLKNLIDQPYPVIYAPEYVSNNSIQNIRKDFHGSLALVYYFAFYLLPALFGKFLGWRAANTISFGYGLIGVLIAAAWIFKLAGRLSVRLTLLLVFFSGMDFVGYIILKLKIPAWTEHIEWWAVFWQYSSNTTLLFWVPHQGISAWILTSLLMNEALIRRSNRHVAFITAIGAFWSVWVCVGLLPFMISSILINRKKLGEVFTFQNVIAASLIVLLFALFYMSQIGGIQKMWLWQYINIYEARQSFLLFYLLEFVLLSAVCFDKTRNLWWWTAVVSLMLLPLYRIGVINDFVMRVSIPSLFVIMFYAGNSLINPSCNKLKKVAIFVIIALGALTPTTEIYRSLTRYKITPLRLERVQELASVPNSYNYFGYTDSVFFEYIAKRNKYNK